MDAVFGEAKISIEAAPGTENWDTDYYGLNAEGMTPEQKAAEGAELARRAEGEGIVLLKNQNNALPLTGNGQPLSETNTITVNALGWSFYYPSTGGSGSGAVGSDGLVSPKEALAAAGIQINEELENYYLDWSNQHYTEWMVTKANGYYTDEDTNTAPARPSVSKAYQAAWDVPELNAQLVAEACDQSDAAANNVQIVWIGRGGGEYHDCPTVMTKEGGSVNTYGVNPDKHYLELTDEEEAVLAKAEELRGDDGKVIVIINANNTMELGELADDDKVDAILFVGGPGKQGFYAIQAGLLRHRRCAQRHRQPLRPSGRHLRRRPAGQPRHGELQQQGLLRPRCGIPQPVRHHDRLHRCRRQHLPASDYVRGLRGRHLCGLPLL